MPYLAPIAWAAEADDHTANVLSRCLVERSFAISSFCARHNSGQPLHVRCGTTL